MYGWLEMEAGRKEEGGVAGPETEIRFVHNVEWRKALTRFLFSFHFVFFTKLLRFNCFSFQGGKNTRFYIQPRKVLIQMIQIHVHTDGQGYILYTRTKKRVRVCLGNIVQKIGQKMEESVDEGETSST